MAIDFKDATDELFAAISHQKLAEDLGVSVATVRQARLDESALAHRSPPPNWEAVVAKLAKRQAAHFSRLARRLGGR